MTDGHGAHVAELWRYPVKSMQGERVDVSDAADAGFTGDRAYAVIDPASGKVGSAKHPRLWGALLQCKAPLSRNSCAGRATSGRVDHPAQRRRDRE